MHSDVWLRSTYKPGDWGWVIAKHGTLYAAEKGWGQNFETMVARLVSDFASGYDADQDHFWFAERGDKRLGSVFLARDGDAVGRLRFLLVDPEARGSGIGRCLIEACVSRARAVGYTRMVLATHADLLPARHLYSDAGFSLVNTAPDQEFGGDLEHWELALQ